MTIKNLKEKVDGNELDLSLNELTEVPVKELALAPKAINLDLSCNLIVSLPNEFATLKHLVKIDLSKNKLTALPENFGNLVKLQHLDLYGNKLVTLPTSFCRLKSLQWLDLKANPLDPKLMKVAGDCLNEKECEVCAKNIVAYMQLKESEFEREKQKHLKKLREKEAEEKAMAEKELEEQRRQKKMEKEKRKKEYMAKKEIEIPTPDSQNSSEESQERETGNTDTGGSQKLLVVKLFLSLLLWILIAMVVVRYGMYGDSSSPIDMQSLRSFLHDKKVNFLIKAEYFKMWLQNRMQVLIANGEVYVAYYFPIIKDSVLGFIHNTMIAFTHVAEEIEKYVADYFRK